MVHFIKCFFVIFLLKHTCASKKYDGFQLLRGIPDGEEDLNFFKNLTKKYDVDMWQPPFAVDRPVDFIVSPEHASVVKQEAEQLNIPLRTLHSDIQSIKNSTPYLTSLLEVGVANICSENVMSVVRNVNAFDNQTVNTYSRRNTKSFNWHSYYRHEDILDWMKDLSSQYPSEISLLSIGKTIEERDIIAMKMVLKGSKRRSAVIIEGGIHAREWIAPAMVTYLINELVRAREGLGGPELRNIAFDYEWYFIPVFNLDGYEYSHTTDRMWRKNRRGGYGVDLNRNFDAGFGTFSVEKTDKKSELYCGPEAFSEPETQNMRNFLKSVSERLSISHYVSFHSYGQYFYIPYTHSKEYLENYDEMKQIGDKVAARIKKRYGTEYKAGLVSDIRGYLASGVSACWAKKAHKIRYVGIFELRDKGEEGFALAASKIPETCRETMDGLLELFKPSRFTLLISKNVHNPLHGYHDDETDAQSKIVVSGVVLIINVIFVSIFIV